MSPGSNKRQTGTVPKTKSSRKNAVPQEMVVAPTRRDFQQHLNDFFAQVQRASKRDNSNRTPGEGTCYDLDNFSLPGNTWPVRPIPRRNYLSEGCETVHPTNGNSNSNSNSVGNTGAGSSGSNAAIGVVIPTTPNLTLHQHQNQLNEQLLHHNQQILSMRVPDGAPQQMHRNTTNNNNNNNNVITNSTVASIVDNISENIATTENKIQDYIRITTSLIDSMNTEKPNGPRPQSVSSIHTTASNTPTTYEELQSKLENSNRNIMHIKEQQQQLLRLQQAAKNQLFEMEQLRAQQGPVQLPTVNGENAVPDYGNVEEVAQDVGALMLRMKTLTDFIHSQNDLASSLGVDEKMELMEEQTQLQRKLMELKNKKQQMASLVNELQAMNNEAENSFYDDNNQALVENIENASNDLLYERLPHNQLTEKDNSNVLQTEVVPELNDDVEVDGDGCEDDIERNTLIKDKISQINAMKDQLKRLQDMMHTVKLIEIKNGDRNPNDEGDADGEIDGDVDNDEFNGKSSESANDLQSKDDPQRDEEEQMAERVRALHNMTNDLRHQAVSLAAERDRLKDIKNEMARRRDYDGSEKNFKPQPIPTPQHQQLDEVPTDIKASLTLNTKRIAKPQENNENIGPKNCVDNRYSPNWLGRRNVSSTPSLQSSHGGCNHADNLLMKQPPFGCNQGKDSTDSGAAELNMSVEAASTQSCSSRGFSVPPPMRNISTRDGPWLKTPHEISRLSLNNQTANGYENQTEQNYPWYWHCNQSCNSAAPQSPAHCYYHHHMCPGNSVQSQSGTNDPVLMQQFIQTQQMLINSMSQCNQLLWDQQREINNLNSAVLLIQERLLNSGHSFVDAQQSSIMRAESVPPNVVCTSSSPFLPRAQSEQPQNFSNYPPAPVGAMQRNNQLPPTAPQPTAARLLRQPISNQANYHHQLTPNRFAMCSQFTPNSLSIDPSVDHQQLHYTNNSNFLNNLNHQQNLTNTTNSTTSAAVTNSNVNATNTVTALNNQVPPGIRANNYYDNFRSYSRQNLLSSGSCKSNEAEQPQVQITHNNLPSTSGNKFRNQINQNTPPDVLNVNQQRHYHGIVDNYNTNSRDYALGKLRCNSTELTAHGQGKNGTYSEYSDNGQSSASTSATAGLASNGGSESNLLNSIVNHTNNDNRTNGEDQKSINSYNFDINELKQPKMTAKTLQKCSTGGTKRVRPLRDSSYPTSINETRESHQHATNVINQNLQHLNLANSSNQRSNSKSPSKLFDDLKENVYLEVSALIAANESRPHFLINLFRELQLISSSDPLRKRLMQAFQEVYTNSYESNSNILPDVQATLSNNQDEIEIMHRNILQQPGIQRPDDIENGLASIGIVTPCAPDIQPSIDDNPTRLLIKPQLLFQRKPSSSKDSPVDLSAYLDLTEDQENVHSVLRSKPNDLYGTMCHKDDSDLDLDAKPLADVVVISPKPELLSSPSTCVHPFIPNGNQDLAEADQLCNENNGTSAVTSTTVTDLTRSESPSQNGHGNGLPSESDISDDLSGAIGGVIETPTLPDLAKVIERDDGAFNK